MPLLTGQAYRFKGNRHIILKGLLLEAGKIEFFGFGGLINKIARCDVDHTAGDNHCDDGNDGNDGGFDKTAHAFPWITLNCFKRISKTGKNHAGSCIYFVV